MLVVEDEYTRIYLRELWQDPSIGYVVANSKEAVGAVVDALRADGLDHVFGVRDRDFGPTNHSAWSAKTTRVFTLPAHEIENYSLDFDALAQIRLNSRRMPATDIKKLVYATASSMIWWMACRKLLSDLDFQILDGFPGHPTVSSISDKKDAENFLSTNPWLSNLSTRMSKFTLKELTALLESAYAEKLYELKKGHWVHSFSGKELLAQARNQLFVSSKGVTVQTTDWALEVARWHNQQGIPQHLQDLYDALMNIVTHP